MAAKKEQAQKQTEAVQATEAKSVPLELHAAELLAAASYMIDILPSGCIYHGWRVGLVAERLASMLIPEETTDVFYAGLMQDIGTVGAEMHITQYTSLQKQLDDPLIRSHPRRGAGVLEWLPGMSNAAKLVRSHHEWWDGRGYPEGKAAREIPVGSQILSIAENMDTAGCFISSAALVEGLHQLAVFAGHSWSSDVWTAVVHSVEDSEFYKSLMDPIGLQGLMADGIAKHKLPAELDTEEGIERIFHVYAAMIDAKDSSTDGHSLRVAQYAKRLAERMGLSEEEQRTIYRAGLVHDCGRLGVPASILKRAGGLNDEEMNIVRHHAQMTIRVMSCMPTCPDMAVIGAIAGHDHECYDGTGYPDRLVGEYIHILSRILSVADSFDAMTASVSYKHLLSPRFALIRLKKAAGTQFDPRVVECAIEDGVLVSSRSIAA